MSNAHVDYFRNLQLPIHPKKMKKLYKLTIAWLISLATLLLIGTVTAFYIYKNDKLGTNSSLQSFIGKKLDLKVLLNPLGDTTSLKFNTEWAIVNFWFAGCGPCIETMNKYHDILALHSGKLTMISINTDHPNVFKALVGPQSPLAILQKPVPNWHHYVLYTSNVHPRESLYQTYSIKQYPAYMVINQNLEITHIPYNPIWYAKRKLNGQPEYWSFLVDEAFANEKIWGFMVFGAAAFSTIYWLIVVLIVIFKKFKALLH